jgi:Predicted UDP-glucose 6-dehydrogenase
MNIAIVGVGYVGLVSGACFSKMGLNVVCADIDENKIQRLLKGDILIFEPKLDAMVLRNMKEGRLRFTTNLISCLDDVEIVFSAVGAPIDEKSFRIPDWKAVRKAMIGSVVVDGRNIYDSKELKNEGFIYMGASRS